MTDPWLDDGDVRLYLGDAVERLRELPDASVQCIVTSPPFFGLRDYGTGRWVGGMVADCDHKVRRDPRVESSGLGGGKGSTGHQQEGFGKVCGRCGAVRVDEQIGLEDTPEQWVEALVEVFRECRRVLRDDGVFWLEVGDTYATRWSSVRDEGRAGLGSDDRSRTGATPAGYKNKDLIGAPWMLAFALRADGWYLRRDVIWDKPNTMPESATDRPTTAHSYVFLLTKSARYFYDGDAIREEYKPESLVRIGQGFKDRYVDVAAGGYRGAYGGQNGEQVNPQGRNARSVWRIVTEPTPFAHFATMPTELARRCIAAGTSEAGCCIECGAPWGRDVEAVTVERSELSRDDPRYRPGLYQDGKAGTGVYRGMGMRYTSREHKGWSPTCACQRRVIGQPDVPPLPPDSFETIASPTGEGGELPDPSMTVGRGGLARPRSEDEGTRPMFRYEQRAYAEQLRMQSPVQKEKMRDEAGGAAFDHYLRTDRAGARAIPPELLVAWLQRGWLKVPEAPVYDPPPTRPCVVLDPFSGSATTALVARRMGRHAVGIELSEEFLGIASRRLQQLSLLG